MVQGVRRDYIYLLGFAAFLIAFIGILNISSVTGNGYFIAFILLLTLALSTPLAGAFLAILINSKAKLTQKQLLLTLSVGIYVATVSIGVMIYNQVVWKYIALVLYALAILIPPILAIYSKGIEEE